MTLSTTNGMVVDDTSVAPNGPSIAQQIGNQVDEFYGKKYATLTALLAATGKFDGQQVWVDDIDAPAQWIGGSWRLGQHSVAAFANLPSTGRVPGQRAWLNDELCYAVWNGTAWRRSIIEESYTDQLDSNFAVNWTSGSVAVIPGLSVTVDVPSPNAIYDVTLFADVSLIAANLSNIIEGRANGSASTLVHVVAGGSGTNVRMAGSKQWRWTGLAAGSRVFDFRTYNGAAASAQINAQGTVMKVERVG